jgi:hypothetical protein
LGWTAGYSGLWVGWVREQKNGPKWVKECQPKAAQLNKQQKLHTYKPYFPHLDSNGEN